MPGALLCYAVLRGSRAEIVWLQDVGNNLRAEWVDYPSLIPRAVSNALGLSALLRQHGDAEQQLQEER